MKKLSEVSIAKLKKAVLSSKSCSEVLRILGISKNGGNQRTLKKLIEDNNISVNHFTSSFMKNPKEKNRCIICGKIIRSESKFCSSSCLAEFNYRKNVKAWLNGEISGTSGNLFTKKFIRRYLFSIYNNSCQCCGWSLANPYTKLVPLQIHHIDGNCQNNSRENLLLLCPNCHSLTENFGRLNNNSTRIKQR